MVRQNYDEMKIALLRTRKRYSETRGALLEHMESATLREANVEAVVTKWKAQLESRTKELENLQLKLAPQDIDMLRIKLQEELEATHSIRVASMDQETDKWRQMFFKVRLNLELCIQSLF